MTDSRDDDDAAGPDWQEDRDNQQHDSATALPEWHYLPAPERAEFILSECAAGRWLSLCRQPLDEEVLAVLAATEACIEDRPDDMVHVLHHHDKDALIATLIKILGEVLTDQGLAHNIDYLRVWSSWAVVRSS